MQGITAFAVTSLTGCGGGGSSNASTSVIPSATPTASALPPSIAQPVPSGMITPATLTVGSLTTANIPPAFAGLSYEKSTLYEPLFTGSNAPLIGLFQRLGSSVLRIGGNSVDKHAWTPNGAGQTPGQIAPSDVAALAAFVKATGWQILYGINLGGSASGQTTPALAAAEAAYASQQFGSSLLGIEIGNECDLYGDSGNYYAGNWSLSKFLTLWSQYRQAVLAATPGIPITGPASASNIANWTIPFGRTVTQSEISLLTQHYYRANGALATSTASLLVSPDTTIVNDVSLLAAGARQIGVPFRMAECNSFYNGGSTGVSDSYASSLWVIDYLFACAQGGASGVNLHGGGNSGGYTPIADSSGTVVGPRPEYYGILLFLSAGTGPLYQVQTSAGSLNVTAYAVQTPSGGMNIVVVNKDSANNVQCSITLPQVAHRATLVAMTQNTAGSSGPSLSATSGVSIAGAQVSTSGGFTPGAGYTLTVNGTNVTCYVPALSAALITVT